MQTGNRLALVKPTAAASASTPDAESQLITAAESVNTLLRGLVAAYKRLESVADTDSLKAHCLEQQSQLLGYKLSSLTNAVQRELDDKARELRESSRAAVYA